MKSYGFTLIELVLVIVIVSILASISLPRYINLKTKAITNSESAIIASVNLAIKNKFSENVANGLAPENAWPTDNPFTLLAQGGAEIPNTTYFSPTDNYNWRTSHNEGTGWRIFCPHWNGGSDPSQADATKGIKWIYNYSVNPWGAPPAYQGDLIVNVDRGH
jgi:prepilin-type N-terminal cleavage/methylation domain-containing protein